MIMNAEIPSMSRVMDPNSLSAEKKRKENASTNILVLVWL